MTTNLTSNMLLIQPLKIDDINIVIKDIDDEDGDKQSQQQQVQQQAFLSVQLLSQQQQQAQAQHSSLLSPIDVIDDDELLAILGLPASVSTSATSTTVNSPVNESSLLDWNDMPELSESEEEYIIEPPLINNKRKFEEDIFAQFDFEEANPYTKKLCHQQNPCVHPTK